MKLYFRLLWLILTQSRRSRCTILGPVDSAFRVLPNDLDALLHMNNGVYFTLMDLGRTDLLLRSNQYSKLKKNGWYPVVAAETIRFRRSLKLFRRFIIRTHVAGWDDRSIYLEQQFISGDQLIAKGVIDARFLSTSGDKVTPAELLLFLGIDQASPELPNWIQLWAESNAAMVTSE